jgi:hypothetical protein
MVFSSNTLQQSARVRVQWLSQNLIPQPLFNDSSGIHDQDSIRQTVNEGHIMADQ